MTTTWTGRYVAALERLLARRDAAAAAGELIACGTTNNVDVVAPLSEEVLARLVADVGVCFDGARQTRADTPARLVTAIVQHVAAGAGVDLPASAAAQDWLLARVAGRRQLGGTGAQVANQLTRLGFGTLIHLTACSPEQAAAFDHPGRTLVPAASGLCPVTEAADPADATMYHPVLEYGTGLTVRIDGRAIEAPAANRIIVNHDPVNSAIELREAYVAAVLDCGRPVRRVLHSGFSQTVEPARLARFMEQSIRAVRRWKAARPDLLVHVELGAMPRGEDLAAVIERLAGEVDSIGMNADELRDATVAWGIADAGSGDLLETLAAVRERVPVPRLNVHTAAYAMSVTTGDPEVERDALLVGALTASTRARIGSFPSGEDLGRTLKEARPHPDGLALLDRLGQPDGIGWLGGDAVVVVPTVHVPQPAGTIGLGDSFAAGTLALL